jgi:peptide/nickel transport system substrate-binding protein
MIHASRALRTIAALATLLSVAALLAPAVAPAAAEPSGTITIGAHVTLATRWLDPMETDAEITPFMIFYALHDALVKPMPGGLNTPSLAESWTTSRDGRVWDFTLRKGVRFHNGEPVTAEDVKFSFERYRGAAGPILKERVREVQAVDAGHVRFILRDPWPDFMTFYGTSASGAAWIVPKKYVEKVGEDGFKKAPIGAGPYKFVSFQPGIELVLEAFDGYWRKTPSVKRLVLRSIPDESTRAAALKRGEIDIAYYLNGPIADDVRRTPGLTLTAMRTNGLLFLVFPEQWTPGSPWADRRVRQAASLAIDRQTINEAEALGYSAPTGGIVPRHQEFALAIPADPYDPKRARALLAEAGFPTGFDAGELTPFPPYNSMGEAIANYLGAVGIKTRVRTMERATLLSAWRDKKLRNLFVGAVGSAGNASTRIESLATAKGVLSYGAPPELEPLFQAQLQEMDRRKREETLHQIQRLLQERVLFAPIWENGFIRAYGPRVEQAAMSLIPAFPYVGPPEELRLKAR